MNSNQIAAYKNLEQAQQALKSGDKDHARQLAAQASQLAPELEEVWLLMAALASPRDSIQFLEKALQINPASERAQKGMAWAQGRLKHEEEAASLMAAREPVVEPVAEVVPEVVSEPVAAAEQEEISPEPLSPESGAPEEAVSAPVPAPVSAVESKGAAARSRTSLIAVLIVLICLILAWVGWQGLTPITAFLTSNVFNSQDSGPAWAEVMIVKSESTDNQPALAVTVMPTEMALNPTSGPSSGISTLTPTALVAGTDVPTMTAEAPTETPIPPTALPTLTVPAPTATAVEVTATPLPTDTQPAPTEVIVPTATIAPSLTPLPTDVLQPSAVPQQQASPTPLPTDTAEPGPTKIIPPTPKPGSGGNSSGRWIDVDLTNQRVYAYEGNTVVNSFIVSTGTWQYPTVTGQYRVYVKYRYTDMSGPGYYLPNVPYTMYFYQGYAIHGTYWHNNFGTPMSHGCVNFSIPDAEWIYNFSSVGTLVNVHY